MQRIQSAPAFAASPSMYGLPRPSIKRTKTSVDFLVEQHASHPVRRTASVDTEDAFGYGGFFPASARETEFGWVREVEEEVEDDGLEMGMAAAAEDDVAYAHPGALIRSEDRLGVLTIFDSTKPTTEPQVYGQDERLYSPYNSDDHLNEDSLHFAFMQRAAAHQRGASSEEDPVAPGELFHAESEGAMKTKAGMHAGGWGLSALQRFAGVF